jgi:hypothetical protein
VVGRWRRGRSGWEVTNGSGSASHSGPSRAADWVSERRARLRPALKRELATDLADEVGRWISEVTAQRSVITEVDHVSGVARYDVGDGTASKVVTAWGLAAWTVIRDRGPLAQEMLESLADPTDQECDVMISAGAEEEWVLGLD